jgi:hypothetical protein
MLQLSNFLMEQEFIAECQHALQDWLVSLLAGLTWPLTCLLLKRVLDPTNYSTSFPTFFMEQELMLSVSVRFRTGL